MQSNIDPAAILNDSKIIIRYVSLVVAVVVAVVVEAELFSDDVAAFPEQAEIPVITIMPLKIAASILFFIGTFLSLTARFLRCGQSFFIVSIIL